MNKEHTPQPVMIIESFEAIKAIADPLRNQILEVLTPAPLTINQIAHKLGLSPSKLYYHVNMLEKYGFINMVDTTVRGNIIEKHYWITAYDYQLDKCLLNFNITDSEGKDNIINVTLSLLDTTREDFVRSMEARAFNLEHGAEPHPREVIDYREVRLISEERVAEFQDRLRQLLKEFESVNEPDKADSHPWALTTLMYPSFYYDQGEVEEE
jgi:DNA-binding Lrp family transcriptional regulator